MARNTPKPSRNGQRIKSSRVERPVDHKPAPTRQDRRLFWVRMMAGLLVLAMLLPVAAGILSLL